MVTGAADAFEAAEQNRRSAGTATFRVSEYFMSTFSIPRPFAMRAGPGHYTPRSGQATGCACNALTAQCSGKTPCLDDTDQFERRLGEAAAGDIGREDGRQAVAAFQQPGARAVRGGVAEQRLELFALGNQ